MSDRLLRSRAQGLRPDVPVPPRIPSQSVSHPVAPIEAPPPDVPPPLQDPLPVPPYVPQVSYSSSSSPDAAMPRDQFQAIMASCLQEMVRTQQQIVQQGASRQNGGNGAVRAFRSLKPKVFSGTESVLQAQEWLSNTEKLLASAGVSPELWVDTVQLQLEDIARTWWISEESRLQKPVFWATFQARFLERFFPLAERMALAREFANLTQGSMSIEEYTAQYIRLSQFAPEVANNPLASAAKYESGLSVRAQLSLSSSEFSSLDAVIRAARKFEKAELLEKKSKPQYSGFKRPSGGARPHSGGKKQLHSAPAAEKRLCNYCQKPGHVAADCYKRLGLCLICGSSEHQVSACPKFRLRSDVQGASRPSGSGGGKKRQAFTMTAEEADGADGVIAGMI